MEIVFILIIAFVLILWNLLRWNYRKETERNGPPPKPDYSKADYAVGHELPESWIPKQQTKGNDAELDEHTYEQMGQQPHQHWTEAFKDRFYSHKARLAQHSLFGVGLTGGPKTDVGRITAAMLDYLAAEAVTKEIPENPYADKMFEFLRLRYLETQEKVNRERAKKGLEPIGE